LCQGIPEKRKSVYGKPLPGSAKESTPLSRHIAALPAERHNQVRGGVPSRKQTLNQIDGVVSALRVFAEHFL
jgi:hypothetical protein